MKFFNQKDDHSAATILRQPLENNIDKNSEQ